jgi:hypothetical protein
MPSRSFSSEKSYSPSRLKCRQAAGEPWATASRNASRSVVSLISSSFATGRDAGKPRGRDAGGVQDSEAAHLNS